MATYEELTETQKRWYHALWDETGGAISPDAIVDLYPEEVTTTTEEVTTTTEEVTTTTEEVTTTTEE